MSAIVDLIQQQKDEMDSLNKLNNSYIVQDQQLEESKMQTYILTDITSSLDAIFKEVNELAIDAMVNGLSLPKMDIMQDREEEIFALNNQNDSIDTLNDNQEDTNFTLNSIDNGIAELVQRAKEEEAAEDVGSLSTTGKDDEDKFDFSEFGPYIASIGNTLASLPLIGGPISKLGAGLSIGTKAIKGAAKRAIGLAGPIAALGLGVYEMTKGLQDSERIVGKSKDEIGNLELAGAGLSGVISGLTLGLVDAKTVYKGLKGITDTIIGIGDSLFEMLPDSVQGILSTFNDFLFDKDEGIFGFVSDLLAQPLKSLRDGNYLDAFTDIMVMPIKGLYTFAKRSLSKISDVGPKIIDSISYLFTDYNWSNALSDIPSAIGEGLGFIGNGITTVLSSIWQSLGPEIQADIGFVKDKISGYVIDPVMSIISSVSDTIVSTFTSIGDWFSGIPTMIGDYVKNQVSGIPIIGDKLSSLFTKDEIEPKKETFSVPTSSFDLPSNIIQMKDYNDSEIAELQQVQSRNEAIEPISQMDIIPLKPDGESAVNYSKERRDKRTDTKGNSPVVVNNINNSKPNNAPIQTRISIDDMGIGLMNASALDS